MKVLPEPIHFSWDKGNKDKNWIKHKVDFRECEEVFFDENKEISRDKPYSKKEERFIILGKTEEERLLFIVFTMRGRKVRVISARDINRKEKKLYEKAA